MFQIYFQINRKKGYSLIEALIYVSMLSVFLTSVIYASSQLIKNYSRAKSIVRIESSAIASMDRMIREIRFASSVDTSNSCLFDPPFSDGCDPELGVLKLNKIVSGSAHNVRFFISEGRLMLEEDNVLIGPITSDKVSVVSLKFRHSTNDVSEALKIQLTLESNSYNIIKNFYDTAVLRGSYQ